MKYFNKTSKEDLIFEGDDGLGMSSEELSKYLVQKQKEMQKELLLEIDRKLFSIGKI